MTPKRFGSSILSRINPVTAAIASLAIVGGIALLLWQAAPDRPVGATGASASQVSPATTQTLAGSPAVAAESVATAPGIPQGGTSSIEVVVSRNDTMDAIFRRTALDTSDLATIRQLPGVRQSLDLLKPGDKIKVTRTDAGGIRQLSRRVSETQTLEVLRGDRGFAATMIDNPVQTRIRTAGAIIASSLFQAAESSGISDTVALKLADVFAYDIDFVLDIREGDRFIVEYEQIYQNGRYLRDGEVLAAEFVNDGRTYRAVRFTADSGLGGYYSPDGKPLRKAFLRAPVDFTRVSSGFAQNRLHPILNLIRGHMGTDYAAPTGTPIHAAGEGHVSFEGARGGYGNAIVLLHANNVSTLYGHMSRFARNVHPGSHVNQGDVIGYVGMTGLATGPHLHYEYLKNGVHMNPQTVPLPGAEPLRAGAWDQFVRTATPLLGNLSAPPSPPSPPSPAAPTAPTAPALVAAGTGAGALADYPQAVSDLPSKTSVN